MVAPGTVVVVVGAAVVVVAPGTVVVVSRRAAQPSSWSHRNRRGRSGNRGRGRTGTVGCGRCCVIGRCRWGSQRQNRDIWNRLQSPGISVSTSDGSSRSITGSASSITRHRIDIITIINSDLRLIHTYVPNESSSKLNTSVIRPASPANNGVVSQSTQQHQPKPQSKPEPDQSPPTTSPQESHPAT